MQFNIFNFQRGAHIIVATPGRLNDFVGRGVVSFKSIRFFVLDEADRMLDMGFKQDIEKILNHESMVDIVCIISIELFYFWL